MVRFGDHLGTWVASALALAATGCGVGGPFPVIVEREVCVEVDADAECPTEAEAKDLVPGGLCETPSLKLVRVKAFTERRDDNRSSFDTGAIDPDKDACCYTAAYRTEPGQGCVIGRPLLDDGHAVTAPALARAGWTAPTATDTAGLSAAARAALAAHWTRVALFEHASIASFGAFALDLLTHGAPAHLVAAAHAAAADEVVHAQEAFALAAAFGGAPVGPGPLAHRPAPAADLAALACAAAVEGAVGETLAVCLATAQLAAATDPAVRAVLGRVVQDESRHAALAWGTLRWAIDAGGDDVRAAVLAALDDAMTAAAADVAGPDDVPADAHGHGLVSGAVLRSALADGLARVVRPARDALAAGTLEA